MSERSLRVTVLGLHYWPEHTGNAPYTTSFASGLRERGMRVRVLTGHPHYPEWRVRDGYGGWRRPSTHRGVPVTRLAHYVPARPSGLRRLLSEVSFGVRLVFERWGAADVVLLVSPALFASAVASLRPRPLARRGRRRQTRIVWVQDLYSLGISETKQGGPVLERIMHAVESFVLRRADGVAVIHDRFREHVVGRLGVAEERVRIVRNWTHLAPFADLDDAGRTAVRARHGWRDDETVVLHAGNMGVKQGLENVVAAARLADEQGAAVRFVLLGDGNRRAALQAEASGIRCLQFIDPVGDDEFAPILQSADALLVNELPGLSAMSVPSKLTSYFAAGRPVIAATDDRSVTAGEIAASGAGVRVDAGAPAALVAAAEELASDPARARRLGAAGRAYRDDVLGEREAIDGYAIWVAQLGHAESAGDPRA